MRITDTKEIDRLLKKKMLSPELAKSAKATIKASKRPKSNAMNYCPFPPGTGTKDDPASFLAHRMIREFGCFFHGGDVVLELECIPGRKYRADIALPRYKVSVEIEGWQFHSRLGAFQKDRERMLCFFRRGWRVLNVSNKQVKEEHDAILAAVKELIRIIKPEQQVCIKRLSIGRNLLEHEK